MNKSITFIRKKGGAILNQVRNTKITTWLGIGTALSTGIGILSASFAIINYQDKQDLKTLVKKITNDITTNQITHLKQMDKNLLNHQNELNRINALTAGITIETIQKYIDSTNNQIYSTIVQLDENIKKVSNNVNGQADNILHAIEDIKQDITDEIKEDIKQELATKLDEVSTRLLTQMQIDKKLTLKHINAVKQDKEGHARWSKIKLQTINTTLNKILDYSLAKSILKTGFKWFWASS